MMSKHLALGFLAMSLSAALADSGTPLPPPVATPQPGTNQPAPKLAFETPVYDFGRAKSGDVVKCSFLFTNTGDQVFEVTRVQPSCGCTAASEWTRKVDPGQTGVIPIQFNTANFNGQVLKTVSVFLNNLPQPATILQLKGTVWKPIELLPPYTVMTVGPDAPSVSAVIRIVNNLEQPIELSSPECSNAAFTAVLQTNKPGKEFQLTLSGQPPFPSTSMQGKVTLRTTATNMTTLDVPFWANVQPAVMVMPGQVMLPAAPLSNKSTPSVTIQNNSTNLLTLSEPKVTGADVEVEIKEMQPGKVFSAMLSFPQGFEIPPGKQVLFTAKSSNPRMPLIQVPIMQLPRPAMQPAPPVIAPALQPKPAAPAAAGNPTGWVPPGLHAGQ